MPASFRASPSGLTGTSLTLEDDTGHIGALDLASPAEIRLQRPSLTGGIERISFSGYRLRLGEVEVTATRERGSYVLRSGETVYEARLNPLKNSARAQAPDGGRIEVRGGLLRRSYEVVSEGETDESSLGVEILLLYMTAMLRRRAFTV